jgi:hypothetical protein
VRILLATSFHEHLPALAGFHLNWRAAFSGRMVTLAHLSATTRRQMLTDAAEIGAFPSAEGLIVNPFSVPTRFGSALPMLIHNHHSATRMGLAASHICLASPYLYAFQSGLDAIVADSDCGLPPTIYPMHQHWFWHEIAAADTRLAALAKHLGTELRVGRADGVFMTRALFDEMLTVVHRFFSPAEIAGLNPIYPLEEILFPTVLPALLGPQGRVVSTRARVWEGDDLPTQAKIQAAIDSGLYACGKRIPQDPTHPIRRAVLAHLPGALTLNACLGTIEA